MRIRSSTPVAAFAPLVVFAALLCPPYAQASWPHDPVVNLPAVKRGR